MTREQHIEAALIMGVEPDYDDLPIDYSELSYDGQMAINLFHLLPDKIDSMGGNWLGKEWSGLFDIMDIYEVEDKKTIFEYLIVCQGVYFTHYAEQKKINEAQSKSRSR